LDHFGRSAADGPVDEEHTRVYLFVVLGGQNKSLERLDRVAEADAQEDDLSIGIRPAVAVERLYRARELNAGRFMSARPLIFPFRIKAARKALVFLAAEICQRC